MVLLWKMSSKKITVIIVGILAAVCIAAAIAVAFFAGKSQGTQKTGGIIVDSDASEWDKELENVSGSRQGIKIPGYGEISVAAGSTTWDIVLANPEDNNCYFKYSLTIDDSKDPIYESDWIEPGKAVKEFKVEKALDKGEYELHLNITACTLDESHDLLNGADVKAVLHVV